MTEFEEPKPRRRRTRQEVQRLVNEFRTGGLSRGEFCRIHGVRRSTLERGLKREGDGKRLVRVKVIGGSDAGDRKDRCAMAVVLAKGRRIELSRDFDAAQLRRVVEALEGFQIVFGLGPATRIYVALGATDLRKGFDGLYGIVRDRLGLEVRSGHLFLFANARRNRLKILYWDGSGLWSCAKRLEGGRFSWPVAEDRSDRVSLSHEELSLLLGGIDLKGTRRKDWYRKTLSERSEKE